MSFVNLASILSLLCIIAVSLAVLLPRWLFAGQLRRQLKLMEGEKFTPDRATWQDYLASAASAKPLLLLLLYLTLLILTFVRGMNQPVLPAVVVTLGVYLLIYQLLSLLPPTYGITRKGVTVLSWLPPFPLGLYGSGSLFIPWQAVEICAIEKLSILLLTNKLETRLVFPPEKEEQVCLFIDSLLRRRGYKTNWG